MGLQLQISFDETNGRLVLYFRTRLFSLTISVVLPPRFQSTSLVHTGRLARVYRGWDKQLGRDVSIKIASRNLVAVTALRREATIRLSILHSGILPLFDGCVSKDSSFLVGPWLAGTLSELRFQEDRAEKLVPLVDQLLAGLDALHTAGWLHGDINASNVMFTAGGQPCWIDFGSARRMGEAWFQTVPEGVTPPYVPPEAWRGLPVFGAGDLYSLAVTLFHILTGEYPYAPGDWRAYRRLHGTKTPRQPNMAGLPPGLEPFFRKALSSDPQERFTGSLEFGFAFRSMFASLGQEVLDGTLEQMMTGVNPAADNKTPDVSSQLHQVSSSLGRFWTGLKKREQSAFLLLLDQAERSSNLATAQAEALLATIVGPMAALWALEDCGVAAALAAGLTTPAEIGRKCGLGEDHVKRLLDMLVVSGLAISHSGSYALPPPLNVAYKSPHDSIVRDALRFWSHLPNWVRTGKPFVNMIDPLGKRYSGVVPTLRDLSDPLADKLAGKLHRRGIIRKGMQILDVGCGAGTWGIAMARVERPARLSLLDLPEVLPHAKTNARQAGLSQIAEIISGDWKTTSIRPKFYDLIVMGNVCHLEDKAGVAQMLRMARQAIRPTGKLIIVDWIPQNASTMSRDDYCYALRLALRSERGWIHCLDEYRAWAAEQFLEIGRPIRVAPSYSSLTALLLSPISPISH
jgi:serine/threonine protein kinase/SAM-dependent methyltransferase